MPRWTPPPGTKVVFDIDAAEGSSHSSTSSAGGRTNSSSDRRIREFCSRFDLKWKQNTNLELRLDDARWPAILDALEGAANLGLRVCWLVEPPPKSSDPHAWFKLSAGPGEFRSPAKAPESAHLGWRDGQNVASEQFLQAVRDAGLTGLASLPLEDARPSDPKVWREIYAQQPIGRGLDHPMLDPAKHAKNLGGSRFNPARRWGERRVRMAELPSKLDVEHEIFIRLLVLAPAAFFRIEAPERFVREHLPATDFAYKQWGIRDDTGPGYKGRPIRSICCNARARRALIDAGVMKPSRFEPLATVPAAEANAEILDRAVPHPLPLPVYTPEEAAAELARRERAIAKAAANPAPARLSFATIDDAIAYLQRRLDDGSATWTPSKDAEGFEDPRDSEHFARTPLAWQRIVDLLPMQVDAPAADGGDEDFELELVPPVWNDWLTDEPGDADPEEAPSTEDLIIAQTGYGDWYAVRMGDPLLPADARVVHWDHETTTIADEWPNIAAFVAEIIAACDRAGDEEENEGDE